MQLEPATSILQRHKLVKVLCLKRQNLKLEFYTIMQQQFLKKKICKCFAAQADQQKFFNA